MSETVIIPPKGVKPLRIIRTSPKREMDKSDIEPKKRVVRIDRNPGDKRVIEPKKRVLKLTRTPSPVQNVNNSRGKMAFFGLLSSTTISTQGFPLDELKSALQKYIRRGITEKALQTAIEMFRFSELEEENSKAKAVVTNLINRISVIAIEDVGLGNVPVVLGVLSDMLNQRKEKKRDLEVIVYSVAVLCDSPKTRYPAQAWFAYTDPKARKISIALGLEVPDQFSLDDRKYIRIHKEDEFFEGEIEEMKYYALAFRRALETQNMNAMTWAKFYMLITKNIKVGKRNKFVDLPGITTNPDVVLWQILSEFLPSSTYNILAKAYFDLSETLPFLQLAITLAVRRSLDEPMSLSKDIWINQNRDYIKSLYSKKLVPDDFIFDKHTRKGKQMGRNMQYFITEGCKVEPEIEIDPVMLKIFTSFV